MDKLSHKYTESESIDLVSKNDKKLRKQLKRMKKLKKMDEQTDPISQSAPFTSEFVAKETSENSEHKSNQAEHKEKTLPDSAIQTMDIELHDDSSGENDPMKNSEADLEITKENVAIITRYISLCAQIDALMDEKEKLSLFVPESVQKLANKKRKKPKNPLRKKKVTAYLLFFKDIKKTNPNITMKEVGAQWRDLDNEAKTSFLQKAADQNDAMSD